MNDPVMEWALDVAAVGAVMGWITAAALLEIYGFADRRLGLAAIGAAMLVVFFGTEIFLLSTGWRLP